jgi:transcription elongation factor GreA
MDKFQITKKGYEKLKNLLENLKNIERPKIINQIAAAREIGDLKENADYHAAREKQGFIEAQISDFEEKLSRVEVVDIAKINSEKVVFGATIYLRNLDNQKIYCYKIVSEFEANIDQGLISNSSPVARAVLGKEVGDDVEIKAPGGVIEYEITKIEFIE